MPSTAQNAHITRLGVALAALFLALAACGGGEAETADPDDGAAPSSNDGGDSFTVSGDGGEVVVGGTTGRPDWLPAWVELPNGLEITTQFNSSGLGESAVLGIVEGESQAELLAEAVILVQSNDYVIGEQYDTPNGKGFTADHRSDGTRVVFAVGEFVEGSSTWSMEFYSDGADGDSDEQVRNEEPTSRYETPGVMTVTVGGQTFEVIGSCELEDTYGTFVADDARSVFDVFEQQDGSLGAVGGASLVIDGEVMTVWNTDDTMETIELEVELTDDSIYYEGGMRENTFSAEPEPGIIEIDCG